MPPISVLMKPASGLCNMKCDYCFYCDETAKRKQESYGLMSEKTLRNVIRRTLLRAEGSITYAFQGGEPTLRGLDFFQKVIAYEQQYNKPEFGSATRCRPTATGSMRTGVSSFGSIISWWVCLLTGCGKRMICTVMERTGVLPMTGY